MSGRTEMSTTLQDPNVEAGSATSAVIALIGPNATHRRVMAKALTGVPGRTVREFSDYPAGLSDVPNMMEEGFDVVMIDVDSDQSYALQIVETIAAFNTSIVMVYSMRNDADLLRECMRAGARDFLPLPDDADGQAETSSVVESQSAPEVVPPQNRENFRPSDARIAAQPVVVPVPEPVASDVPPSPPLNPADFLLPEVQAETPAGRAAQDVPSDPPLNPADFLLPEALSAAKHVVASEPGSYDVPSRPQFIEPPRVDAKGSHQPSPEVRRQVPPTHPPTSEPSIQPEELRRTQAQTTPAVAASAESGTDFSAWDSQWILSAKNAAKTADLAPSAAEPAAKRKAERVPVPSGPQLVQRAAQHVQVEEPAPASPLFQPIDADKTARPRQPWVRWAIFAGVPIVVIGLGMLIFMTPSRPSNPASSQGQAVAPQEAPSGGSASGAGASQKPLAQTSAAKPSAGILVGADQSPAAPAPVAADMMNAQLSAPSRIASQVKNSDSGEAAPGSFSPNAMDNGTSMPGPIFGNSGNLKIVPGVSAISAGVAEGMLIRRAEPVYPEFAKAAHVSGTVVLGGEITKTGSLAGLHVLSGPAVLRAPALDAVKNWRYRPYMLNNEPVEVQTTIKVIFSLDRR